MAFLAAVLAVTSAIAPAAAQNVSIVRVEEVAEVPLTQTVPIIGRLVARRSGDVATRISGPLERFHVEVGDRVREGQAIAELNTDTLRAELHLAEGKLQEAEAALQTAKAERDLAAKRLQRQKQLMDSAAFSKARYEDAELDIAVSASKIKAAEAKIATQRAEVERRQLDVDYAKIKAPFNGVILQRYAEIGSFVQSGEKIAKVLGVWSLEVEVDVPSRRIDGLAPGQKLDITLDDGSRHEAVIRAILPAENPLTRTRAVRLEPLLDDATQPLAEGQSATVAIPAGRDRNVVAVSKDAVLQRAGTSMVYVVEEGIAQPRDVKLGEAVGARIEVESGLKPGDMVVVRGNERLTPGATVQIEKSQS